jgi:hypothetical protein
MNRVRRTKRSRHEANGLGGGASIMTAASRASAVPALALSQIIRREMLRCRTDVATVAKPKSGHMCHYYCTPVKASVT